MTQASAPAVADATLAKAHRLDAMLRELGSVVVAFSGGVDSAYLAVVAADALGARALAVTGDSPSYPDLHRQQALDVARAFHLAHELVETDELARPGYRANAGDRCFHCKTELYDALTSLARARGFTAVVDGSNADDRADYRPGRRAASEHGVRSPLDDADLGKDEIRALARARGLSVWDAPASACLSSRVPHHTEVTAEVLRRIEAAERGVRTLGFAVFRVRHHDQRARIEIGRDELSRALAADVASQLVAAVKAVGYTDVEIDPRGYRQGSLNEPLLLRPVS